MKKIVILLLGIVMAFQLWGATETNEYYFRFQVQSKAEVQELSRLISIDNVKGNTVYAYANDAQWDAFSRRDYAIQILPHPGINPEAVMSSSPTRLRSWDAYPTYEAYVTMMYAFATQYPELCQIVDAGTTVNGRKILFAKISDNVATHEVEPEVMYTSTMHGDETVGYILMLRLIDTLLSGYGSDARLTALVNNLEIWINPNANPDGTYYGGNSTVGSARRNNFNGVDLNRNFPTESGNQADGYSAQPETTSMTNLALNHRFALSANFHGGAEVVNYPWDCWQSLHPDNDWYISLSTAYASSAQAHSPAGYLDDFGTGITNGYAWYSVAGGRQDWMNYTAQGREVTIEIGATKNPAASTLPNYWTYNYDAMLTYLEYAYAGIHGMVKDASGTPLPASITIEGHDTQYSVISTDPAQGDFYRFLAPGSYTVVVSTPGYDEQRISNVLVNASGSTALEVVFGTVIPQQTIALNSGWNWISLNVVPEQTLSTICSSLPGLIQLKSTEQSYCPQMPDYFNTLSSLEAGRGYWLSMSNSSSLVVTGQEVELEAIALKAGWNYVGYLPQTALAVPLALGSISAYLEELRYGEQSWTRSTLTTMEPGKAYWIKVAQDCSLLYPEID